MLNTPLPISPKVFAVVGVKGGVGKSTITAHLAGWLARRGDVSVAVLDAFPQRSSSTWLSEAAASVAIERADDPDSILELIPQLAERFDVVICDGPAGAAEPTRALLLRSDTANLPWIKSFSISTLSTIRSGSFANLTASATDSPTGGLL